MVTVRFSVFPDKVRNGTKKQTIRPINKYRNLSEGKKVHCYSTKKVSYSNRPILDQLLYVGICTKITETTWEKIKSNNEIAKLDGFEDAKDMQQWFTLKYPSLTDDTMLKIIQWK